MMETPPKVLIADDDAVSRRLLQVALSKAGYEPTTAVDGLQALLALEQPDAPRLLVLDWMMPRMDGLEVCRAVRQRTANPYVYIVLLTANDKTEEVVQGLEADADDYLRKPFNAQELEARLRTGRRILQVQDQVIFASEILRAQATHDSLTGLWNRGAILDMLQNELARSQRSRQSMAVIMADLDHFKNVNDTYGHLVGDRVLRDSALSMQTAIRSYDSIGRYGGEEFLIVAPGCELAEAGQIAERLREAVANKTTKLDSGVALEITTSLGVAATNGNLNSEELLRAADDALYEAKRRGRNAVTVSRV
jgi:two-component system cell cycle response regulator